MGNGYIIIHEVVLPALHTCRGMHNKNTTTLPLEVFTQRYFIADLIRLKLNVIFLNRFLSHFLGDLGLTYAMHL